MLTLKHLVELDALELQPLYEKLQKSVTLASLVLAAWQIGLWFARTLVNHNLNERVVPQKDVGLVKLRYPSPPTQAMECRLCGHPKTHKHGKMPNGHQRYFCPNCQQTFCERFDTLYYYRHVSPEQIDQVLQAHSVGIACRRHRQ